MDALLPEIRSLISDEVGIISKLAIVILVEKKLGQVASILNFYENVYLDSGTFLLRISENTFHYYCAWQKYQETWKLICVISVSV